MKDYDKLILAALEIDHKSMGAQEINKCYIKPHSFFYSPPYSAIHISDKNMRKKATDIIKTYVNELQDAYISDIKSGDDKLTTEEHLLTADLIVEARYNKYNSVSYGDELTPDYHDVNVDDFEFISMKLVLDDLEFDILELN